MSCRREEWIRGYEQEGRSSTQRRQISAVLYRDSQTESIDHPRGPDGERYGDHHEDDRKPVDFLQADPQVLGGLVCYWCKSQPYLEKT